MILLSEEGVSVRETARRAKVVALVVSNWRKRFGEQRLAELHEALKSGHPHTYDEKRIAQFLWTALPRCSNSGTHWGVRKLAEDTRISKCTVQRYFSLFGVQLHRVRNFILSNDPFFIEKVREVVGLYLNPPDNALVLCVDENS